MPATNELTTEEREALKRLEKAAKLFREKWEIRRDLEDVTFELDDAIRRAREVGFFSYREIAEGLVQYLPPEVQKEETLSRQRIDQICKSVSEVTS